MRVVLYQPSVIRTRAPSRAEGKGSVYVVRDGHVHLTPVVIGQDNGVRVGILLGLTGKEQVVRRPPSTLSDGAAVIVSQPAAAQPASH